MMFAGVCKAESRITVPEVESVKIRIDGKEGADEWESASLIAPMLSMKNDAEIMPNGQVYLISDRENIYIAVKTDFQIGTDEGGKQFLKTQARERDSRVYDDDAVEIILSAEKNSPNYHQIIVNSIGTVYDAEYGPDGASTKWNLDGLETASTVNGTSWFLEVKLPRKELGLDGKSGFLLNICRDWAQIRLNSTLNGGNYFDRDTMFRLELAENAPPVRMSPPKLQNEEMILEAKADGIWEVELISPTGKKEEKKLNAAQGVRFSLNVSKGGMLNSKITSPEGKILFDRSFRIRPSVTDLLPPADQTVSFDSFGQAQLRFYPGLKRMGINAFFNEADGYTLAVSCQDTVKRFPVRGNSVRAIFPLPDQPGKYSIRLQLEDKDKNILSSSDVSWERRAWEWENRKLGLADRPVPPFGFLKTEGEKISALTQCYTSGNLGLWSSLLVDDKELLAAPIAITAVQDGKELAFRGDITGYQPAGNVDKVASAQAEAGGIQLKTTAKYECDGMMYMTLELSAEKATTLDQLTLSLPLKEDEVFLMHAVGDLIRGNPTGRIPSGEGVVWDSRSVPCRMIDGKPLLPDGFTPYIWLGGIDRGICFFADSNRGYALDGAKPMIKLVRNNKTVTAEISLIGKKVEIGPNKRVLSFGLQGTPVKPRLPFTLNVSGQNKKRIRGANMLLMWITPPGLGYNSWWAFDPGIKEKWALFDWFSSVIGSGKIDLEQRKEWRRKLDEHFQKVYSEHTEQIRASSKYVHNQIDLMRAEFDDITKFAPNTDHFFVYSDPRLAYVDSEEYPFFRSEWLGPQQVGYVRAVRVFLEKSLIDRMLYTGYQRLQHGADGIYYDDTFILPTANRETDPEGNVEGPAVVRTGILAMRELVKRTALMSYELKKEPFLMVHHTDAMVIPCFSFANLGFTWEMTFLQKDTQERFSEDYIFAESNGKHAGLTSFVISGIRHWPSVRKNFSLWASELRQKTLSLLAVTLQHQMKTYGRWDIDQDSASAADKAVCNFRADNPQYKFIPYWAKDSRIVTTPGFKACAYMGDGKALIIVSSYNSSEMGEIRLDFEKLGIPPGSGIYDLVRREFSAGNTAVLDIPRNLFTILFAGAEEEGKSILSPEESSALRLKASPLPQELAKLPFPENWQANPSFVEKSMVAKKYQVVKDDSSKNWIFTIDNTEGDTAATMIWTTDYPAFKVTQNDSIVIHYRYQNTFVLDIFTFSGKKDGKSAYLFFPREKLWTDGKKAVVENSCGQFSSLRRLYVRVTAKAGTKAKLVLESVEKRHQ